MKLFFDTHELPELAKALQESPKEYRKQVRPALRKIGEQIKTDAASNASWSTRIPGAMGVRTNFSGARPGVSVFVRASGSKQQENYHAKLYEGILYDTFTHPFYGHAPISTENSRPYLYPAVDRNQPFVLEQIRAAIDAAMNKL